MTEIYYRISDTVEHLLWRYGSDLLLIAAIIWGMLVISHP